MLRVSNFDVAIQYNKNNFGLSQFALTVLVLAIGGSADAAGGYGSSKGGGASMMKSMMGGYGSMKMMGGAGGGYGGSSMMGGGDYGMGGMSVQAAIQVQLYFDQLIQILTFLISRTTAFSTRTSLRRAALSRRPLKSVLATFP